MGRMENSRFLLHSLPRPKGVLPEMIQNLVSYAQNIRVDSRVCGQLQVSTQAHPVFLEA